jgi:anaerobic ribonucleoside-triphosphate reductase activating protein
MSELLRLHRLAWPVRNLGAGNRLAVWTQGCLTACPGCCSVHSHSLEGGSIRSVADWMATIERILQGALPEGLTVSGGEPTLQPGAVAELIEACRARFPGVDVLLYSGQPWHLLRWDFPGLVQRCDLIVSEPYRQEIPPRCGLHGSGNQTLHFLTPLAKRRYLTGGATLGAQPLAITSVNGCQIAALGIPSRLEQLTQCLAKRGIALNQPSWRKS